MAVLNMHLLGRDNGSLQIIFPFHQPRGLRDQRDQAHARCQSRHMVMPSDSAKCFHRNWQQLCQVAHAHAAVQRMAFLQHESKGGLHALGGGVKTDGGYGSAKLIRNGMGHSGGQKEPKWCSPTCTVSCYPCVKQTSP